MCYDDYLAEKLPINKTKLPSVLQLNYNPVHAARHVDDLKRVPDLDESLKARRKCYIDAFERAANCARMSCNELMRCMKDLLFRDATIMNDLQLAIWYASHRDKGTDSESLAPRSRPTMLENSRHREWATEWKTMQPRNHDTRTSILRKATWDTTHNLSELADLHALRWLRRMAQALGHPEIRHAYQLGKALASDPHHMGYYLAVWFVHDTYQGKYRGTINPMRGMHALVKQMEEAKAEYVQSTKTINYQEYMTHRCMMDELEHMQANPGESNGYKFNCCCKCCQEKQLIEHLKTAHQELDTILEKKGVGNTLRLKKKYNKSMETLRDFVYNVNVEADFDLVVTDESSYVGDPNEHGTEAYNYLIVELRK